jgi:hypothetical protein
MRLVEPLIPRQGSDVEVHRQSAVSTLVYEMVPGGRLVDRSPERWESSPRTVTINSLGFRDEEFQANGPHDGIRIICIGDSNTYGAAVSDEETWPRRLEETLLSEHGAATDVWNLGVSGYGIQQKLLLARRALREFAPDLLIIELYNTGIRYAPVGVRAAELFDANPDLWPEFVASAPDPADAIGTSLWRAWAGFRLVGIVRDRLLASRNPGARIADLGAPLDAAGRIQFQRFLSTETGGIPVFALITPAGFPSALLPEESLQVIDLSALEQPFGDEGRHIHPGARVYRWYAQVIAGELQRRGCLEPHTDQGRQRCASHGLR